MTSSWDSHVSVSINSHIFTVPLDPLCPGPPTHYYRGMEHNFYEQIKSKIDNISEGRAGISHKTSMYTVYILRLLLLWSCYTD